MARAAGIHQQRAFRNGRVLQGAVELVGASPTGPTARTESVGASICYC
jgi:hypothetical protein